MFIRNNRPSFHLWWKENFVKHQKVSKYYENDCSYPLLGSSAEFYHKFYPRVTNIYRKWSRDSGLVGQGITVKSDGSWFKPHLMLCQS